jgi:hypothetical protein
MTRQEWTGGKQGNIYAGTTSDEGRKAMFEEDENSVRKDVLSCSFIDAKETCRTFAAVNET